jgi:hypothetical protein
MTDDESRGGPVYLAHGQRGAVRRKKSLEGKYVAKRHSQQAAKNFGLGVTLAHNEPAMRR